MSARHLKRPYAVDEADRAGDAHDDTSPPAFSFIQGRYLENSGQLSKIVVTL
jgi:hypothetical protein